MNTMKICMPLALVVGAWALSAPCAFADTRDVVHNDYGTIVHTEGSGTCVRTKWMDANDPCAPAVAVPPPPPPRVQVQEQIRTVISKEDRTIYFGFNQASISPEMQQRLDTLSNNLRADTTVKGARIVGYADRIGNAGYNEQLSKKRAENVRQYLIAKGVINTQVADTRWYGSQENDTSCNNKLPRPQLIDCLQRDRRVEVEIDYASEQRASR